MSKKTAPGLAALNPQATGTARLAIRLADLASLIDFSLEAWQVADALEDAWTEVYGWPCGDDHVMLDRFHRWFDAQMGRLV